MKVDNSICTEVLSFLLLFQKWRAYCNTYDKRVEDFNLGTLIRLNSREEFSESNSTLGKLNTCLDLRNVDGICWHKKLTINCL